MSARLFLKWHVFGLAALMVCVSGWGCSSENHIGEPLRGIDALEERAMAYEAWFNEFHVSPYGGSGYAYFEEPDSYEIKGYSFGDSTIWTGAYLAAEAFRYAVTGSSTAKANAIRTVHALDTHLKITQVPGFIARFGGPDAPPWNAHYVGHDRYVQGTGEWEGSFWINNTSRDQYTGWFFGMALAYDLIDDEPTREMIRGDVQEVIDDIQRDGYQIIGENGLPTDAGPKVIAIMRLCWHLVAAHVLDNETYRDRYVTDGIWIGTRSRSAPFPG